jgi:hypothetical protein
MARHTSLEDRIQIVEVNNLALRLIKLLNKPVGGPLPSLASIGRFLKEEGWMKRYECYSHPPKARVRR